jgi:hypothetical protein
MHYDRSKGFAIVQYYIRLLNKVYCVFKSSNENMKLQIPQYVPILKLNINVQYLHRNVQYIDACFSIFINIFILSAPDSIFHILVI